MGIECNSLLDSSLALARQQGINNTCVSHTLCLTDNSISLSVDFTNKIEDCRNRTGSKWCVSQKVHIRESGAQLRISDHFLDAGSGTIKEAMLLVFSRPQRPHST